MSAVLEPPTATVDKQLEQLDTVTIRFAGDSGDGMQLTGTQFTNTSALLGNDVSTFPDFPAEIRAPAGTLAGVSGFQVNIASRDIYTPGDAPQVLVAMNPAALKANIADPHTRALKAGYYYGETTEAFRYRYRVGRFPVSPGVYRKITGNEAAAMGAVTAATLAGQPLFYGSYPITPASDILHHLASLK